MESLTFYVGLKKEFNFKFKATSPSEGVRGLFMNLMGHTQGILYYRSHDGNLYPAQESSMDGAALPY